MIFSMLRSEPGDFRPVLSPHLLECVQAMLKNTDPLCFFSFSGIDSGISLPPLLRFPADSYSFSTWIRLVTLQHHAAPAHYIRARIFSFRAEDGSGVELFFSPDRRLCLSVLREDGTTAEHVFPKVFQEKQWYHIALVHTYHRLLSSQAELFINGTERHAGSIRYPRFTDKPLPFCSLATSVPTTANQRGVVHPHNEAQPLYGQLCATYMFDIALSAAQVKAIHALGSDYCYTFFKEDAGAALFTPELPSLFDGTLSARIYFCYSPLACQGSVVLDSTPRRDASMRSDAMLLAGSRKILRNPLSSALQSIGGLTVFFPLFAQLDQPVKPSTSASGDIEIDYQPDPFLSSQLLSLLGDLLKHSPLSQDLMVAASGPQILSYLLQQVSPKHITFEVLQAFQQLDQVCAANETLRKEILVHFLLNWRLWVYTQASTVNEWLRFLTRAIEQNPKYFRQSCGPVVFLDALRLYFYIRAEPPLLAQMASPFSASKHTGSAEEAVPVSLCLAAVLHPVTKEVIGERIAPTELVNIRKGLIMICRQLLTHDDVIVEEEVQRVVAFLSTAQEPTQIEDVLSHLVLYFLGAAATGKRSKPNGVGFAEFFDAHAGLAVLIQILSFQSERLMIIVIHCLTHHLAFLRKSTSGTTSVPASLLESLPLSDLHRCVLAAHQPRLALLPTAVSALAASAAAVATNPPQTLSGLATMSSFHSFSSFAGLDALAAVTSTASTSNKIPFVDPQQTPAPAEKTGAFLTHTSSSLYFALFGLAIESVSAHPSGEHLGLSADQLIKNVFVFQILADLLLFSETSDTLIIRFLTDLRTLLQSKANRQKLMSLSNWARLFMPFLDATLFPSAIHEATIEIFQLLLAHRLTEKDGWVAFAQLSIQIRNFSQSGAPYSDVNSEKFMRAMFMHVLRKLEPVPLLSAPKLFFERGRQYAALVGAAGRFCVLPAAE
eukprot:TRINITY_DN481_c0_g2_i3.p1 TRINITY_DN481_c0_g2~~TRINITY_DN481_c0_g2_i3.p1  ORF type:complete len:1076 (+),score=280.42 TRINITY_DN481_c0_g2_i3:389-3229(+)